MQSPSRPAVWPALVAYAAAFVVVLGASVVLVLGVSIARAHGDLQRWIDESQAFVFSASGIMSAAVVSATGVLGTALVAAKLSGAPLADALRLRESHASAIGVVAAVFATMGLSVAAGAASDLLGVSGAGATEQIARALRDPSPTRLALELVTIAIGPGIAEETFFRGLIQTRLAMRWGRWPAIAATAFGFGLFHLDPVQGSQAMIAGLLLGWIAEHFGSIRPGMIAHAVNNAAFSVAAAFATSEPGERASRAESAVTIAVGVVVCAAAVGVMRTRRAARA